MAPARSEEGEEHVEDEECGRISGYFQASWDSPGTEIFAECALSTALLPTSVTLNKYKTICLTLASSS